MQVEILCDDRNIVRKWGNVIASREAAKQSPTSESGIASSHTCPCGRCTGKSLLATTPGEWRVYGTWSHGEIPAVSPSSAPLRAICFIEKAQENTLMPLTDRQEITRRLLACVIKPFVTADWWHKTLDLIAQLAREVPCYVLRFDKSGAIVAQLAALATDP